MNRDKIFEDLIQTIERNAVDNKATISNVEFWAKSWREELAMFLELNGFSNQIDTPRSNRVTCVIVEAIKSCERTGVKQGNWYSAKNYPHDPTGKWILGYEVDKETLKNIGVAMCCTMYKTDGRIIG